MPDRIPPPHRAQIWASRFSKRRRFLVTNVLDDGRIRGMAYLVGDSDTRTVTYESGALSSLYRLLEDVPAHLATKEAADA